MYINGNPAMRSLASFALSKRAPGIRDDASASIGDSLARSQLQLPPELCRGPEILRMENEIKE
eukprot:2789210-Karenia_brevis.AAC.1